MGEKIKSFGGELESKVQFLGQRITDIETYISSVLTKERLVNFISGNNKSRMNISNSKIVVHEGVAVSPKIQQDSVGAVAISATHEQLNNNISSFVDKSILDYTTLKL